MPSYRSRMILLMAALVSAGLLLGLTSLPVQAQENPCPPGQEQQAGCKWVQNQRTGRCRWLPPVLVIFPWVEISPVGSCPPLQVEPTATNTSIPEPTATNTSVPGPTATSSDPEATDPPVLPSPMPHPPREQPGGPGNLGYVLFGSAALLGLAGGGAYWLNIARKRS